MNPAAMVSEYYRRVDSQDTDWIVDLFEQEAVYRRAGEAYEGISAIANFFRNERLIRGVHTVRAVIPDQTGQIVTAVGNFCGVGKLGDPRNVDFVDLWTFKRSGLVSQRETYLAIGSDYVRS